MRGLTGKPVRLAVDFDAAVSLALAQDFTAGQPRHFGAPAASSEPFRDRGFAGAVALGASCNCQRLTLVPHCNGTHTESASHLTLQQSRLQDIVPIAPVPALLVTALPQSRTETTEDSSPPPQQGDRLITRNSVLAAWQQCPQSPRALLLRTGTGWHDLAPPYFSAQLMEELVSRGIEHLVTDLPSVDRLQDDGQLTAHRIFFGLPARSTDLSCATRAHCTITELASFPSRLADGPCALQLQFPDFGGDAVPSRPVYLPLVQP